MQVTNDKGRRFAVKVVCKGDTYGRRHVLKHDSDDALVEVYDATYEGRPGFVEQGWPEGQFVSRYYASTLAATRNTNGIDLNGGVDVWKIDGAAWAPVVALAKRLDAERIAAGGHVRQTGVARG